MTKRILSIIRNWEIKQAGLSPEQRNAVREEINEIGDAIEAEMRQDKWARLDVDGTSIVIDGERISVTAHQARVFEALLSARGRCKRLDQIIDHVWGDDPDGGPLGAREVIGVHVCNLRATHTALRRLIATDWGVGFRIDIEALDDFEQIGAPADRVMANLARKTGRIQ